MRPAKSRERRQSHESVAKSFPVALLCGALVALFVVLPTSLRPLQPPPNTSAELSPDAPPDDQESIVAALNRGTSGTAGDSLAEGGGEAGPGGPDAAVPSLPNPTAPPRSCPRGFGDPPRQVESLYAAPCAPAWQGDNGGATYKGVTGTEVRIGVVLDTLTQDGLNLGSGEGPAISNEPQPDESAAYRTWRVYQRYFNQNFQLWGRQVRFFVYTAPSGSPEEQRAAVQDLDEEHHVFAIQSFAAHATGEGARRKLAGEGGLNWSGDFYARNQPYLAAWWMDGTRLMTITAEYLCKRMMGHRAEFAGDPSIASKPRKLGLVTETHGIGEGAGYELPRLVKQRCGADMVVHSYSGSENADSSYATAVSSFRLNDVTTVVADAEGFYLSPFLSSASAQGYYPEWFIPGTWANDQPEVAALLQYNRAQWSHAFGISGWTMQQHWEQRDHHRAYRSVDPDNNPASSGDRFASLLQLVNGIQMAGPTLTPQTWRDGLDKMGVRSGPPWAITGGFSPTDHTYVDDVNEIWWDDSAPNPALENSPGTYRYVECGRRIGLGSIPDTTPRAFDPAGTCLVAPGEA